MQTTSAGLRGPLRPRGRSQVRQPHRAPAHLSAFAQLDPGHALYALTLAWTGARVSEGLALTPVSFQIDDCLVAYRTLKQQGGFRYPGGAVAAGPHAGAQPAFRSARRADRSRAHAQAAVELLPRHRMALRQGGHGGCRCQRSPGLSARAAARLRRRRAAIAGAEITLVQRWLGHARLSSTAIYTAAMGPEEISFAGRFWSWAAEA